MIVPRKKTAFLLTLTSVWILSATLPAKPPEDASISDLSIKNMDFAMNLYRKISSSNDNNVFLSPLSISTSFAALLLASDGATRDEMVKGLNLEQLDRDHQPELIPKLFQLLQQTITHNGSLEMEQDMALFVRQQLHIEKNFQDQIKMFFDADIQRVDFADVEAAISSINEHVKRKTGNKVGDMISSLDPTTQLMLINTIFFQGNWKQPFNPNFTENTQFHIDNYNIVQVPMMFQEEKFYTTDDTALGVRLLKVPYQEGVAMLVLLPDKGVDYTTIDDEINARTFRRWIKNLHRTKLEVSMPKFKMSQSYSLQKFLPDLGFHSIFSSFANLTKLNHNEDFKLSEVLHKAVVEVDETGTTAAAATTAAIIPYSLPRSFTVDRPFFFFIYHEDTNCLLFMGRVIDPTKN